MKSQMTLLALIASLWTAAPALAHPKLLAAVPAENATVGRLILRPAAPLSSGTYVVAWHAVSTDTHRVAGRYSFTVR